jgi:hypothetical protein
MTSTAQTTLDILNLLKAMHTFCEEHVQGRRSVRVGGIGKPFRDHRITDHSLEDHSSVRLESNPSAADFIENDSSGNDSSEVSGCFN